jgi:hypothetical protein
MWTGGAYLFIMTISDIRACTAYRRVSCLKYDLGNSIDENLKEEYRKNLRDLVESLSDYERIFRYVDVPFLLGVAIILLYKFTVLDHNTYYLGFIAGTIAMHTILANVISLFIAGWNPKVEFDICE